MKTFITMVLFRPQSEDLAPTLRSLAAVQSEFEQLNLLISGNAQEAALVGQLLREVGLDSVARIEHRYDNLGFADGHNSLLEAAWQDGADACLVLNPDMRLDPGAISELLTIAEKSGTLGLYGPSLARVDVESASVTQVADSMGVTWTPDGRHFDRGQGDPFVVVPGRIDDVEGLTGACLLVTREAYARIKETTGWFFDSVFLAYREDAELGIRARIAGVPSKLVHVAGFGHVRTVRGYSRGRALPDLLGVRNRFILRDRLGAARPSRFPIALIRDAIVAVAARTIERSSLEGLESAQRIHRFTKLTSSVRASPHRTDAHLRADPSPGAGKDRT